MAETLRSDRWSEDQKAESLFWLGAALAVPYTLSQIFWALTGRGPIQRLYQPNVAFVDPLRGWRPVDLRGSFAPQMQARRDRYGDVPLFVPPSKKARL